MQAWNEVQAKLAGNSSERRRSQIESGALLGGLVFDDRGNRMSPTYTSRKRGRYRYYVSQAFLHDRKNEAGSRPRVNADNLERIVIETLRGEQTKDGSGNAETQAAEIWNQEVRDGVRQAVTRIVVHAHEIEIVLSRTVAEPTVEKELSSVPETEATLRAPLPDCRPRARKQILVSGNSESSLRRVDQALILALARARTWLRALRRGDYKDTAQIARRFGLSEAHVRRILRLAFLAPDIVEAIVEGRQPRTLTVKILLRSIPLAWTNQRAALGFFQ